MEKNRQKKRIKPAVLVLIFAAAVAVVGVLVFLFERYTPSKSRMDRNEYFGLSGEDTAGIAAEELAVVTNGEISEYRAIRDGEAVYLDYRAVSSSVNRRIWYDEEEEVLVLARPDELTVIDAGDGADASLVKRIGDDLYLSRDFLDTCTDWTCTEVSDPARLVIFTRWSYAAEDVTDQAYVRYRAGIKSPVLRELAAGETVRVRDISSDGTPSADKVDGWTYVTTKDGFTGYVQDKYLKNLRKVEEEHEPVWGTYTSISMDEPVNMAFHQVTNRAANASLEKMLSGTKGLNVIAPTWFFLNDREGNLTSLATEDYVAAAHEAGLSVWAVVNDFDGSVHSAEDTAAALSSFRAREMMVSVIMEEAERTGFDGVNVDFEKVTEDAAPAFLEFVRELSSACRARGLVLSVDNYVPEFTKYLDRREQGIVADYVVTMCYDEHTAGSAEAGSVASLPYVKKGIEDTLLEVPAEKVIAAIPFFTRFWVTRGSGAPSSSALGMEEADRTIDDYRLSERWDEETGQNYAAFSDGDTKYEIWLEDRDSVAAKMQAVAESGVAGVAEWKLGLEKKEIWDVIASRLAG